MSATMNVDSKRATTIVVELSNSRAPPTLPFELKDHISLNTWAARMSMLSRLALQYSRPALEKAYVITILVLTFLVPLTTYYITLHMLENANNLPVNNDTENKVWLARFTSFAITIAMWIILSLPMVIWKYLGEVRVTRLVGEWTKSDAAPSRGASPVWKASTSGLFRDVIILTVSVPKKSHFDRNSDLPPYIAAGDNALPPYQDSGMVNQWSTNIKGSARYGELPIYHDDKLSVVQV